MKNKIFSGWYWVPTAFFAEGAPFMIVSAVTAILFKSLGMNNADLAFWTGLMMLPWSIKPLWAPLLDWIGTKRGWIIGCQLLMGILLGAAGLLIRFSSMTAFLTGLFFLLAFASATHDAAADGFYLLALDDHGQAFFAGIRSTFYRIATVCVQGGLVAFAGVMESTGYTIRQGWSFSLAIAAAVMILLSFWHVRTLPRTEIPQKKPVLSEFFSVFRESCSSFLRLPGIGKTVLFLFLFRIAEAQLGKIAGVFLIDKPEAGGLGLSLASQGFLYGTVGVLALTVGGILGGVLVAEYGFRKLAWILAAALNLPDAVYLYLALCKPDSLWIAGTCIAVEQFGYGLGYTAFMMVMIAAAAHSGKFRTTHFAFFSAIAVFSLILFGMVSGKVQQITGYPGFFTVVMILTIPSFLVLYPVLKLIPEEFGKKRAE